MVIFGATTAENVREQLNRDRCSLCGGRLMKCIKELQTDEISITGGRQAGWSIICGASSGADDVEPDGDWRRMPLEMHPGCGGLESVRR